MQQANPTTPSFGVIVFGVLQILIGVMWFLGFLNFKERDFIDISLMIVNLFGIFLGMNMLQLRPFARIVNLRLAYGLLTFYLLAIWGLGYSLTNHDALACLFYSIIGFVIVVPIIFFLRHPKVRQQFSSMGGDTLK